MKRKGGAEVLYIWKEVGGSRKVPIDRKYIDS